MNPREWLPTLSLFGTPPCVYCGGIADTSDHTPPRCLLPRKFPAEVQAMTVPACMACNAAYSKDEVYMAAVVCTVSFTIADRAALAEGGWLYSAMQRDGKLRNFIESRLGADGIFRPDQEVVEKMTRVMKKTAVGLLFHEFGRLINRDDLEVITFEHAKNVAPTALAELYRRDDNGWPEVTPSGRELERHVMALQGRAPRNMPNWRIYIPEFFEYMFLKRSNNRLLCVMTLHEALTVLLECPWPTRAGPRRKRKR